MPHAVLIASDFSGLGAPFIGPFFLGGAIALLGAVAIGARSRWFYGALAFIPIWACSSVTLFVLELGFFFMQRTLTR